MIKFEKTQPFDFGINNQKRFEIMFDRSSFEVYYANKTLKFSQWPDWVQLQFGILIETLHNLYLIPDKIYKTRYLPLIHQIRHYDDLLEELQSCIEENGDDVDHE